MCICISSRCERTRVREGTDLSRRAAGLIYFEKLPLYIGIYYNPQDHYELEYIKRRGSFVLAGVKVSEIC